jgi:hypothetical protein
MTVLSFPQAQRQNEQRNQKMAKTVDKVEQVAQELYLQYLEDRERRGFVNTSRQVPWKSLHEVSQTEFRSKATRLIKIIEGEQVQA